MSALTYTPKNALEVEKLINNSPFLDLNWHFDPIVGLSDRVRRVQAITPTIVPGTSFATFQKATALSRSRLGKKLAMALTDTKTSGNIGQAEELDLLADYILNLKESEITGKLLVDYYAKAAEFIRSSVLSIHSDAGLSRTLLPTLLDIAFKWPKHLIGDEVARAAILSSIESIITEANELLITRQGFTADLLESQNCLIYCYLALCGTLKSGIHPIVLSRHLLIFRKTSPTSWITVEAEIQMQYTTLAMFMALTFYPIEKPFASMLGISNNTLADLRSVFRDAANAEVDPPFTVHKWVFRWFAEKLDADVFSIRGFKGNLQNLQSLSEGEQNSVVSLSQKFSSYRFPVTTQHLANYLLQFGTTTRIRGAIRLLQHSRFFPLWELSETIERLLKTDILDAAKDRLIIAPLGDQTGSTAIIKYLASHSLLQKNLVFAEDLSTALTLTKSGDKLYFVDDCLLSGTQTLNILGDLMGTRVRKPHHTKHCDPLLENEKVELMSRELVFAYCIGTDIGQERFISNLHDTGLDSAKATLRLGIVDHSSLKAFESLSPVGWTSKEEREDLKTFSHEIGYAILKNRAKEKDWDEKRRQESALGFSDFQRLLIFPYNVPKTTVTFLWEHGDTSQAWTPLFPSFD